MHRQVDAIQMGTHNICFYKEVDKKYTGYNLKTTEWLVCVLMGVCAVIRSNTLYTLLFGAMMWVRILFVLFSLICML